VKQVKERAANQLALDLSLQTCNIDRNNLQLNEFHKVLQPDAACAENQEDVNRTGVVGSYGGV